MLQDNFPLVDRFVCGVYPSGTEDVITAPYNVALATEQLIDAASCVFPVENRALLNIVNAQTKCKSTDTDNYLMQCKPFQDMNSIVVNMLLHLTSGSRFTGSLNTDMSDLVTNMVPFPKIQFLCSSYSPLTISSRQCSTPFVPMSASFNISHHIQDQLFNGITNPNNHLVKIDPLGRDSFLLGVTLAGRGAVSLATMRHHVTRLQRHSPLFTPWSRTAIKVGLCDVPPAGHPHSLLALYNTTNMRRHFTNILNQFVKLYKRKAHVHHYNRACGGDGGQMFAQCQVTIEDVIQRYSDIVRNSSATTRPINKPRINVL